MYFVITGLFNIAQTVGARTTDGLELEYLPEM